MIASLSLVSRHPAVWSRWFPWFWGTFILLYACGVIARALVLHIQPGLATAAGFAAVIAVWLDFSIRGTRSRLRILGMSAILVTILLNALIIQRSIDSGSGVPWPRSVLTAGFAVMLFLRARAMARGMSRNNSTTH